MSDRKTTPRAGLTLLSREDDKLKFFHSPSGAADFALKHKLNKQVSLGLGFTVRLWFRVVRGSRGDRGVFFARGAPTSPNLQSTNFGREEEEEQHAHPWHPLLAPLLSRARP